MDQQQKIIEILQKNYNKISYYEKIVTSLEFTLELEETEQYQSYQEILQILIEEESTSQELIKAIKEIQQSSEERFEQTLELAKKIALKKKFMNQSTLSKEEADKQLKFTEIVQRNNKQAKYYKDLTLNLQTILQKGKENQQQSYQDLIDKISGINKLKKEHEIHLITEIKESSENRKNKL
ncbi:23387_t:CDS:2 [Cetraspora pellucida]|uniref:23387_t:CDS:1 n=1 Tax=Cetraspora pellucida TaxID=1433469 RepID=A0A9N9K287_9GLOM|nr:23387_t:CDS:2 [Cetraspora pellucida]